MAESKPPLNNTTHFGIKQIMKSVNDPRILAHHKNMRRNRDALTDLKVAFNCPAKWNHMSGDDRVRHCTKCSQKVYNISQMTREEAVQLIEETGGKACIRFYQRSDGTILTRPCRGVQRKTYGWKLAGLSALAFIGFPMFTPAYAGSARPSPQAQFRMTLKRVHYYNQQIAESEGSRDREVLTELRKEELKRLRQAYDRLEPEDIEEIGPINFD